MHLQWPGLHPPWMVYTGQMPQPGLHHPLDFLTLSTVPVLHSVDVCGINERINRRTLFTGQLSMDHV